ncbi:hypothetical protein QA645_22870 [Bradyrhizobium sp. CIAT3101]|uniref:hypothetical protein n=1 Tax=Bradyrhizobium sp. CIAT3101 TaxID=439387 RepID=UPI0024B0CF0E|nr:hypothetical protein [Bradyrhizobium sp. CIAT3101]WFU77400.1 hypothetical protein QA645_22870 [Bradyrhizobium sp. CIAT3101]
MATVLIVSGVLTGALGLLDIFLSEAQKSKLDNWTLRVWDWLSDAKKFSLIGWLLRPSFRIWFSGISIASAFALFLRGTVDPSDFDWVSEALRSIGQLAVGALSGCMTGWLMQRHILSRSSRTAPIWAIGYFAIAITLFLYATYLALGGVMSNPPLSTGFSIFLDWAFPFTMTLFTFSAITTLPLLVITIMECVVFCAELIVRRIAESPKGVVLGCSSIATAIGAFLKASP